MPRADALAMTVEWGLRRLAVEIATPVCGLVRNDNGERIATPVCGLVRNDNGERIATPVCGLVRNDRFSVGIAPVSLTVRLPKQLPQSYCLRQAI